jgi:hypothetical protein
MNWFRANRWLGTFLIVFAVSTLLALYFLFSARSAFEEAYARFNDAAAERSRLEHLDPFPSEANYRLMKAHLEKYSAALNQLKEELKPQVLPSTPLAPNEFQSRLRQAMIATAEKARANRVKLPDNFHLGFDEFTAALPNTAAAPWLGQELLQIELLMNVLIDARVDAVTALKRMPLPSEMAAAPTPSPVPGRKPANQTATGPKMLERGIVDLTFVSSQPVARKVLNQIASSNQQFYIIRILHVRNEQEKGPPHEQATQPGASSTPTPSGATGAGSASGAIKFIVGNEHIETSARIEVVRFTF